MTSGSPFARNTLSAMRRASKSWFRWAAGAWSDLGDTAELRNKQGTVVARYAYGTDAAVPLGQ